MKRPLPIKIVIFSYSLLALLIPLLIAYAAYVGLMAERGTLTLFQTGFISGVGFEQSEYTVQHSGAVAGVFLFPFLISITCIVCLLKKWQVAFFIVFVFDALLFVSGIGYLLKIITFALLLAPSSQAYFKKAATAAGASEGAERGDDQAKLPESS